MSKKKEEEEDADVADTNNEEEEDDNHAEATEILTNLLQNHQALPTYDDAAPPAAGAEVASSSVTEGQQAAIQQMIQQLKLGGVALPNGATVATVADGGEQGEKKHAFWDTQVRRMRLREGGDKLVRCDEVSSYIAKTSTYTWKLYITVHLYSTDISHPLMICLFIIFICAYNIPSSPCSTQTRVPILMAKAFSIINQKTKK